MQLLETLESENFTVLLNNLEEVKLLNSLYTISEFSMTRTLELQPLNLIRNT
jgi:hypothetical protein